MDIEILLDPNDLRIFDVHLHTEFEAIDELERFQALSRRFNIYGGLTDSRQPGLPDHELNARGIKRCAIVGRGAYSLDEIADGLEANRYHAIKINLGFLHKYADDPEFQKIYDIASLHSVPIFYHTGHPGWSGALLKYAHPITVDDVAVAHPQLNFVIVHAGNPWFADAALVASKNHNVYLEASALLGATARDRSHVRLAERVSTPITSILNYIDDPAKLLFGSGWPMVHLPSYVRAYQDAVPRQHWQAVFATNAERIFPITVSKPQYDVRAE